MLAVIARLRPIYCVLENVPNLYSRGIDRVLTGLESEGYTCAPFVVGAWAAGAPHKRDRVFIVAERKDRQSDITIQPGKMGDTGGGGFDRLAWGRARPIPSDRHGKRSGFPFAGLGGNASGFPGGMDGTTPHVFPAPPGEEQKICEPARTGYKIVNRAARLKALGNALCPQQVYPILLAVRERIG